MASTRVKTTTVKSGRCVAGTSIAELGPVLFVLFVMILFPLIDLMAIGVTYSSGCVLNSLQVREAALLTASIVIAAIGVALMTLPIMPPSSAWPRRTWPATVCPTSSSPMPASRR